MLEERVISPQHMCLALKLAALMSLLSSAELTGERCLLACLPGEEREKRKQDHGWRDMHRNPVMMHQCCLQHSR